MKQSFITRMKQWWIPAEFRLREPEFTREQLDLLEELIQLIAPNISLAEKATRDSRDQMVNFLADSATAIWRIRRKIEGLSRMPKEVRNALHLLEDMRSSMSEGGVEIVDHIGTIPSKHEAKITETKIIPDLAQEQVIDAIKPTILLRSEVVQVGEVVLGKPASSVSAKQPQEHIETVSNTEQSVAEDHERKIDDNEIEIPLPRKARRKGKSVREAIKQVIQEEPDVTETGRTKRRNKRSASTKQDSTEPEALPAPKPRRKRASNKQEEGSA